MDTLPNITNFCVVKVLGDQTSLVSTKSGHLCIMRQYKFNKDLNDADLKKVLMEFKNIISSHFLLQIDYYFIHGDILYIIFEYCEGGSLHELQQRITLYNDNLYDSELVEWFCQMIASINELICKDILKFCDTEIDCHWFFFKNNCIQLDTSKLLLRFLTFHLPELNIDYSMTNIDSSTGEFEKLSLIEKSLDQKFLITIVSIIYELAVHQKLNLTDRDITNYSLIEKAANELPIILQDLWIRIFKFELTFPEIMDDTLVKETLSDISSTKTYEEPLIFNVDTLKQNKPAFHNADNSTLDSDTQGGLSQLDIMQLMKDL